MGCAAPSAGPSTGGQGKRPLDADLNLVPFIDLLCCCIAFLLITAVWTQMARIDVSQRAPSSSDTAADADPPMRLVVLVTREGLQVRGAGAPVLVPRHARGHDLAALAAELRRQRAQSPQLARRSDVQVAAEDGIRYEELVQTMDALIQEGYPDLALSDLAAAGI